MQIFQDSAPNEQPLGELTTHHYLLTRPLSPFMPPALAQNDAHFALACPQSKQSKCADAWHWQNRSETSTLKVNKTGKAATDNDWSNLWSTEQYTPGPTVRSVDRFASSLMRSSNPLSLITRLAQSATGRKAYNAQRHMVIHTMTKATTIEIRHREIRDRPHKQWRRRRRVVQPSLLVVQYQYRCPTREPSCLDHEDGQ